MAALTTLSDVEEVVDRYLHRPLARPLVHILLPTPVTPNQITILSGVSGFAGGAVLMAGGHDPRACVFAAFLVFFSVVLDCADGQLARARGTQSRYGRIFDGIADNVVGLSTMAAITYVAAMGNVWIWGVGIAAGFSIAAHAWVFDAVKLDYMQRAGLATKMPDDGGSGNMLDSVYALFRRIGSIGVSQAGVGDPAVFGRANRFRMRLWTLLGSGTHFFCIYMAMACSALWHVSLLLCLLIFVVPMNLLFLGLIAAKWARTG